MIKLRGGIYILLAAALPAAAQTSSEAQDQKIQQLERKVDELDQKLQQAAETAQTAASVTADTSGFTIKSGDGNFLLKIGADLQVDNRTFLGEGSQPLLDTALLRRVRPTFSGTVYKYVDYMFRPDFGQGQTVIYDAYVELKYFDRAKVRVGKFKPPVGLERLQSDDDTNFVERGLPTLLAPSRDIGYQISGDVVMRRVAYAIGVFNGVPDNGLSDTAVSDHRDYAGRLFFTPFQPDAHSPLAGLGVGIGASAGNVDGLGYARCEGDEAVLVVSRQAPILIGGCQVEDAQGLVAIRVIRLEAALGLVEFLIDDFALLNLFAIEIQDHL